ncbi:MAG: type III-B CRISPR module RAMP protein Cmr6 [Anaerolineaceae bacterium]
MEYPIPQKSEQAWSDFQRQQGSRNPGLIFDRFVPDWSQNPTDKKVALNSVVTACRKADRGLSKALLARWKVTAQAIRAIPFRMKTNGRLVVGLGRKGPLEAGFTFSRYGFPILPGSSVKGLARAWGLLEIAECLGEKKLDNLANTMEIGEESKFLNEINNYKPTDSALQLAQDFRIIFGFTGKCGKAIFLEALPDGATLPDLQLDILNPHYPDYYMNDGRKAPTDNQRRSQISNFITVAPGVSFWFAVGWQSNCENDPEKRQFDLAKKWLEMGLEKLGAGAKTSAGYGYFIADPESAQPDMPAVASINIGKERERQLQTEPTLPRKVCRGKIKPQPPRIFITDCETNIQYSTNMRVLRDKSKTPKDGAILEFVLQDDRVVEIWN